ncbi:DUF4181 domain-containing protein [Halobacillus rhizosphaerae]|uniref:DUF4181 domain-containing protein n=1 Tax=Halobacillus rhizosphaerae TaxID=3064889 RepID=UPI00398ABBEA
MAYVFDSVNFLKLGLVLLVYLAGFWFFHRTLSKKLGVEKKKRGFANQFVNKSHMEYHVFITIVYVLFVLFFGAAYPGKAYVLEYVILLYGAVVLILQAIMEWKHDSNRRAYLLPLCNFVYLLSGYFFIQLVLY